MSHELRTPLNAILGFGQLIEKQSPTGTLRTRAGYITGAGRHLLNLINEILDISRIEAGAMQLSLEPVNLADVLHEALDIMRPLAAERAIEFTAPVRTDRPVYVLADLQRFKQVLLNLFSNAVKYSPKKGKVSISYRSSGEGAMRIVVSDMGSGIASEKLSRLFTPFDRLGAEPGCRQAHHPLHRGQPFQSQSRSGNSSPATADRAAERNAGPARFGSGTQTFTRSHSSGHTSA